MLLDGIGTALGALEDERHQARRKEAAKSGPRRTVEATARGAPRLWGRIGRLPGWIAVAADFITVGGVLIGGAKLVGIW